MSKFKVGQKVYCITKGLGEVVDTSTQSTDLSIRVIFCRDYYCWFTGTGKFNTNDFNPTLLTLEEARAKGYDVPKQKIVKEKTVYINLYEKDNYVYSTRSVAEDMARNADRSLLAAAYPVTIKYETEE